MNNLDLASFFFRKDSFKTREGEIVQTVPLKIKGKEGARRALKGLSGVYFWHDSKDGKIYIGSSVDLWRRFLSYKSSFSKKQCKNNIRLVRAFKKRRRGEIRFGILEILKKDKSFLKKREQYYLDKYQPFGAGGFNISRSAARPLNCPISKEGRKKISERHSGENSEMSKLTKKSVLRIKKELAKGVALSVLAKKYKVSTTVISNIRRGKTWRSVKSDENTEKILKEKSHKQKRKYVHLIPEIVEALKAGSSMIDLSKKYNIKYTTINSIKIRYLPRLKFYKS